MTVLIIFAVLSIGFMGFVYYYVKNNSYEANEAKAQKRMKVTKCKTLVTDETDDKGKKQKSEIKDIWGIEDIRNGMIKLKSGYYRMIAGLGSIDYYLLSDKEQNVIEDLLMQSCLSFQFPVQFLSTTEIVDTHKIIDEMKFAFNNNELLAKNTKLKEYADNLSNYLEAITEKKEMCIRKSYAIICSDYHTDDNKAYQELVQRMTIFQNTMMRAKINTYVLTTGEIIDLLHRELNRESPIKPSQIIKAGGLELYSTGLGVIGTVDGDSLINKTAEA